MLQFHLKSLCSIYVDCFLHLFFVAFLFYPKVFLPLLPPWGRNLPLKKMAYSFPENWSLYWWCLCEYELFIIIMILVTTLLFFSLALLGVYISDGFDATEPPLENAFTTYSRSYFQKRKLLRKKHIQRCTVSIWTYLATFSITWKEKC